MKLSDLVLETASAFDANRARSLLTVLGVVIGIAAVIAMTALIGGVKHLVHGRNITVGYEIVMNAVLVKTSNASIENVEMFLLFFGIFGVITT